MISRLIPRLRSLWHGLRRREVVEQELSEEFQFHLELRARDLVRAGLTPEQAVRQARLQFGSTERYKDESRASRGLRRVDAIRFSWLDLKLAARMLVKYPGLTLVSGFAIAFAIWVGAGAFEFVNQVVNPTLPIRDGDRIVALRNWDAASRRSEFQILYDFMIWRQELRSVEELGAWRHHERNLVVGQRLGQPAVMAEISASAFRVTRVPALLGRTLLDADEEPNAPPVAVIGHDLWQARFAGDSGVIGQTVRIGTALATIVGVMPKGFAFPSVYEVWIPFRFDAAQSLPRQGPAIRVFGRLAPEASLETARRELAVIGQRTAADSRETHEHLRPQVLPYAKSFLTIEGWASVGLMSSNLLLVMLLVLICANVALLMFARAASREAEIVVRTALGASRTRIVTQLFAEALVLSGLAAGIGLAAASSGLEWAINSVIHDLLNGGRLPFWFHADLSPWTVVYALLLALLAAVIAGVLPALRITRGMSLRLKAATAGGGGLRFGGVWTGVIVAQIAFSMVIPVIALSARADQESIRTHDLGVPLERYLTARLVMDRESLAPGDTSQAAIRARFASSVEALKRRLEGHPAVKGVTRTSHLPRTSAGWSLIEMDEGFVAPPDPEGLRVRVASIDPDYFDVLGRQLLDGRGFHSGDLAPDARTVIVNQPFVDRILGGRNPIGRRVHYVGNDQARGSSEGAPSPWYQIVGIAPDLGMSSGSLRAGIYHVTTSEAVPPYLIIGVAGEARPFGPTLRSIATAVDPMLRLYDVMPLTDVADTEIEFYRFWFVLLSIISAIALLLSLAGVYAVMSFTVSRRTREIGIRVALGSNGRRVVLAVLRRPLTQVALGVVMGAVVMLSLLLATRRGLPTMGQVGTLIGHAIVMMLVCLMACLMPIRRALRVQPTDALRMDA